MNKFFIIVSAVCFIIPCFAQTKSNAKKDKTIIIDSVNRSANKTLLTKFSMSLIEGDRIDLKYAGLQVGEVIDSIEKLAVKKKGEFESTSEFNSRKMASLNSKFLGDLTIDDVFGFVTPVSSSSTYKKGIKYKFNADSNELLLFAPAESSLMNNIGSPNSNEMGSLVNSFDIFDIESKIKSKRTYQASNAYGASISVEETALTKFGVASNKIKFNREELTMERSKAELELPLLKSIIVMKLIDPYLMYNYTHTNPTRDNPIEISSYGKYIFGEVYGIIYYSGLTGEIFARMPNGFGKKVLNSDEKSDKTQ